MPKLIFSILLLIILVSGCADRVHPNLPNSNLFYIGQIEEVTLLENGDYSVVTDNVILTMPLDSVAEGFPREGAYLYCNNDNNTGFYFYIYENMK